MQSDIAICKLPLPTMINSGAYHVRALLYVFHTQLSPELLDFTELLPSIKRGNINLNIK